MLASINPLGERARNRRWGVTVSAYVLGSVLAAASLGAVLGVVGRWGAGPSPCSSCSAATRTGAAWCPQADAVVRTIRVRG